MQITVSKNHENSRIDRFLREYFNAPQGIIAGIIRKGKVKLNGKKVKIETRLNISDIVTIYHNFEILEEKAFTVPQNELAKFKSWIVFENEDFIAINKPEGVASQGGIRAKLSVDIIAKAHNPEARITHRLDKETSGIMIIAKNKASARHITGLFAEGLVQKKYLAITKFNPNVKLQGVIKTNLTKDVNAQKIIAQNGENAITNYIITKHTPEFAIVDVFPKTGKMHQIRVHLASIGMPIFGDEKYDGMPYKRMMLHAYLIEFDDLKIEAKPNEYFINFQLT